MIAFIFDDRLSHDRKIVFQRTIMLLKTKFEIEVLPMSYDEDDLIEHLEHHEYDLVLLPWYRYLAWKKVDAFFGALRMNGTTVAGYFADPVLPFEFTTPPNYHRMILLDLYRFDQQEIEIMLKALTVPQHRTGFAGLIPKNNPIFTANWMESDQSTTRCIDDILHLPIFHSTQWKDRRHALRFFLTGLWSFVFPNIKPHPQPKVFAEVELSEFNRKLLIKVLFKNSEYTLKHTTEWMWPNHFPQNLSIREMSLQADFIRIQHFPESNQLELTAMFVQSDAAINFPNEVRGFWIEPLQTRKLKLPTAEIQDPPKRISIQSYLAQKKKVA
jgi:hypothetical protein